MINSVDHIHIYAAEPERSIAFYTDVLGAERLGAIPSSSGGAKHLLILGGQYLVISAFPPGLEPTPPPPRGDGALEVGFGVAHIGLNVQGLDQMVARLSRAGVDVHSEVRGKAPLRFVYFSAPDGVVIELTEYVLPAHLAPGVALLRLLDRGIHRARRVIGRLLVSAAS